ncbi:MAG: hypothetical protein C5B48_11120 [Candidatus Rokuibacteriota bacterium]|nr:MAG: hypothetical protein C5B48_11120 [Candidatus Rokubacteria bacterium]
MISDGLYALLATVACLGVGMLVWLIQKCEPARLRTWREGRERRRSQVAALELRQAEALVEAHDNGDSGDDRALLRYLELENSIETAKRAES